MPGVVISTGAVSGPTAPGRAPASTFFVIGQAERGPVDIPTRLTSFGDYLRVFGEATAYSTLYDQLRTFFEEGGARAYAVRVAGDGATTGAVSTPLQDRATTPAPTISVQASSPGAWSSEVSIMVRDGATPDTYRIQVLLDDVVVEDYANLRTPTEGIARINDSAAASSYVRLTNLGSVATAPQNNPVATTTPISLSAGDDKRADIVAADYIAALDLFGDGLGNGAVAIPSLGSAVHAPLIAHADKMNRVALLSSERSTDASTLLAQAASLDAPRAGLFAPWVKVPIDQGGGARAISPEGYVAACRSRAHEMTGPWRPGAGEIAKARWVTAADQVFGYDVANSLDAGKVNVIQTVAAAVRVYGWRSTSDDPANWRFLSAADTINSVVVEARAKLEPYVLAPIDDKGHLLASIAGTLEGIVKPMADLGGLFAWRDENGDERDPGYRISVDGTRNTRASLGDNQVFAELGLRPAPTAALVFLTVTKASVTAQL